MLSRIGQVKATQELDATCSVASKARVSHGGASAPDIAQACVKLCRPCFRPALSGCLALAKMTAMTGSKLQLTDGDAVAMATALLDVNVYGKDVKDRQTCLELLIALYQVNTATPPSVCRGKKLAAIMHASHCHTSPWAHQAWSVAACGIN